MSKDEGLATFQMSNVLQTRDNIITAITSYLATNLLNDIETPETIDCNVTGVDDIVKTGVCSNGICEIGEALAGELSCGEDCSFDIVSCEFTTGFADQLVVCSGHGSCSFVNEASCNCFYGYDGDQCDACMSGFYKFEGRCHPRQNASYLDEDDAEESLISSLESEESKLLPGEEEEEEDTYDDDDDDTVDEGDLNEVTSLMAPESHVSPDENGTGIIDDDEPLNGDGGDTQKTSGDPVDDGILGEDSIANIQV